MTTLGKMFREKMERDGLLEKTQMAEVIMDNHIAFNFMSKNINNVKYHAINLSDTVSVVGIRIEKGFYQGLLSLLIPGTKRKIIMRYTPQTATILTGEMVLKAAQIASKKGWKKVYLKRNDYLGECLELVNTYQMKNNYTKGKMGINIGYPEDWVKRMADFY